MTEKQQLWYARYLDFIDSGLSQRQWCRNNHISPSTLAYWIKNFSSADEIPTLDTNNMWVEVQETTTIATQLASSMDISTIRLAAGDLKIELPSNVNPNVLFKLVEGLRR